MLFQVRQTYQKEDFYALASVAAQYGAVKRGLPPTTFSFVIGGLMCLLGVSGILNALPSVIQGAGKLDLLILGTAFLAGGLLVLLVKKKNIIGWLTWRNYPQKNTEVPLEFFEDHFVSYGVGVESHTNYTAIKKLFEDTAHYFLFTGENMAIMIRKDSFVQGDQTEFGVWIKEKLKQKPEKAIEEDEQI